MGRRLRVLTDGTQIHKIHIKEEDRKVIEPKCQELFLVYKKMTNKILSFEFIKTTFEERRRRKKKDVKKQPEPEEAKKEAKEEK